VTDFLLGSALLLAVAAVFVLAPGLFLRVAHRRSEKSVNLDWYRAREQELAREGGEKNPELLREAQLRMIEDGVDTLVDQASAPVTWRAWWLLLPLVLLVVVLYRQLGGAADVALTRGFSQLGTDSNEQDYRALMMSVETRAAQRPDNLHYQAMLGRFYMDQGDYGRARDLYTRLAEAAPQDSTALALASQADYLASGRQLTPKSQMLAEQALAVDPHQPTALGLLGMAAFEGGQYRAAIAYWQRLLVSEAPDSQNAQMIQGVIARAQAALGETATAATPTPATASEVPAPTATAPVQANSGATEVGVGISVLLELPAGASVAPSDTLFVFARNPDSGSRMPIAVKRLSAASLPLALRLDDSDSMAGQTLSGQSKVVVIARISPSGQPAEEAASYQGEIGPLVPQANAQQQRLVLLPK
jgi:cytochrome c-type biogenesis protein CcmH